jgi:hypothetical protein
MESLQIKTGQISLQILDDNGEVRGVFKFNPADVKVATKVIDLVAEFRTKQLEFDEKAKQCTESEDKLRLLDEVVDYFKQSIDGIWGTNSSQVLFGNASTLEMFDDFFSGITPYYQKESKKRMAKNARPKK